MDRIENSTTEFKREYVDDIKKCVIAFANTNGGTIYIGVDDNGSVAGVSDLDNTLLKVSNSIRDTIKPDVTLFTHYETEILEDKPIIKVIVQKGTSSPYYLANKGIRPEGVYIRQGASSVPATETAILKMIKDTDGEKYEEIRSINQDLTFTETEKEFAARALPFGINQQKTLKLMNAEGIYTNLGLLLSDQCRHTIRLAVFEGTTKTVFKDRHEYSGSLLKQLTEAYEFMNRNNRTRAEFEGLHRIEQRDYPVEAVREALLNSLVHRDYAFSGSTLVSVFDDRIEFVSIGGLIKGITYDDIRLGISVARNENLANLFYRLALVEAYGTGIPKIFDSYNNDLASPRIETSDNVFKITLPNTNFNAGIANKSQPLSEIERAVIALFTTQETITRNDVQILLSVSQAMAVRVLKGLIIKRKIRTIGAGKNTKYVLVK